MPDRKSRKHELFSASTQLRVLSFAAMSRRVTARIGSVVAGFGATCLFLAASATSAHVGWNESAKAKGQKVMTYKVDSLTFDKQGWRAHVSFRNVSKVNIGVRHEFAVAFFDDPKAEALPQRIGSWA